MKAYLMRKSYLSTSNLRLQQVLTPAVFVGLIAISCLLAVISISNTKGYTSDYSIFNKINIIKNIFPSTPEGHAFRAKTESILEGSEMLHEDLMDKIIVRKGDTLLNILSNQNIPKNDITKIIQLADREKISSKLKIGQQIVFEYQIVNSDAEGGINNQYSGNDVIDNTSLQLTSEDAQTTNPQIDQYKLKLYKVSISIDKLKNLEFVRGEEDEQFTAQYSNTALKKLVTQYEVEIQNSLVESLNSVGLSNTAIIKLINTYSHQIDFQRQIKAGDKITVIAEKYLTEEDRFSHHGKILYSRLITSGQEYAIYLYSPDGQDNNMQYFNAEGKSIKSSLLKTPVNASRISGHYGYRQKHPVLGYGRMHKGVDFAAPKGTPIYAAGDGIIEFVGRKSGYGNFVVIKHSKDMSTAYAHATHFPNTIRKGKRVKQGETIAYVGATGTATGPHLHFEVRINNKQVNPMDYKPEPQITLAGNQLATFKNFKTQIASLTRNLGAGVEVAEIEFKKFVYNHS